MTKPKAKLPSNKDIQAILLIKNLETGKITAHAAKHVDAIPAIRWLPYQKKGHKIITLTLVDIIPYTIKNVREWLGKAR